jgi:hypothetical protein
MTVKPILTFGWKTIASCVWQAGQTMTFFIIQFLPIYLVNTARAWLDHLPRNSIDCWEDLKEIFTSNF